MTQEFRSRLQALRGEGFSLSAMAGILSREFSCSLSRNAIAGAVHRLKLPSIPKKSPSPAVRRRKAKPKPVHGLVYPPTKPKPPRPEPEPPYEPPVEQRRGLLDLTSGQCRYVVGNPVTPFSAIFCAGAVAMAGCSWCARHLPVVAVERRCR